MGSAAARPLRRRPNGRLIGLTKTLAMELGSLRHPRQCDLPRRRRRRTHPQGHRDGGPGARHQRGRRSRRARGRCVAAHHGQRRRRGVAHPLRMLRRRRQDLGPGSRRRRQRRTRLKRRSGRGERLEAAECQGRSGRVEKARVRGVAGRSGRGGDSQVGAVSVPVGGSSSGGRNLAGRPFDPHPALRSTPHSAIVSSLTLLYARRHARRSCLLSHAALRLGRPTRSLTPPSAQAGRLAASLRLRSGRAARRVLRTIARGATGGCGCGLRGAGLRQRRTARR